MKNAARTLLRAVAALCCALPVAAGAQPSSGSSLIPRLPGVQGFGIQAPVPPSILQRVRELTPLANESLDAAIAEARKLEAELAALSGPQARGMLADVRTDLGHFLLEAEQSKQAVQPLRQAIDFYRPQARQPRPLLATNSVSRLVIASEHLARAYQILGDREAARAAYKDALDLAPATGPIGRPPIGLLLGLGKLEAAGGDLGAAEQHLRRAIDSSLPSGNSDMQQALQTLSFAFGTACQLGKTVARAYEAASVDQVKRLRPCLKDHLTPRAQARIALADVLARRGNVDGLTAEYRNVQQEANAGPAEPEFFNGQPYRARWDDEFVFAGFAAAFKVVGRDDLAWDAMERALRANAERLRAAAGAWAPSMLWDAFASRRRLLASWLHLAIPPYGRIEDARLADWLADSHGTVMMLLAQQRQALHTSGDSTLRRAAAELADLDRRELALDPADGRRFMDDYGRIKAERMRIDGEIRKRLGDRVHAPAEGARGLSDRIAQTLAGRALVGYLRYQGPRDEQGQPPARYVAYRLKAGEIPSVVDLGPSTAIDVLVTRFRGEIHSRLAGSANNAAAPAAAAALYQALIAPVLTEDDLESAEVVVVPDGQLALLPFEALTDSRGRYLIARTTWRYLGAPREILQARPLMPSERTAAVLGDPHFDTSTNARVQPLPALMAMRGAEGTPLGKTRFASLPDTRAEAETVAKLLRDRMGMKVLLALGADASVATLQSVRSPRVLHVATHGFFSGGMTEPVFVRGPDGQVAEFFVDQADLSAGLVLAGANVALAMGGAEGIMFAGALRRLQLHGTELVVLSACDTGIGRVEAGEGVMSMRSAVHESGASSVLASLWPVPSAATTKLMTDFYARLAAKTSVARALGEAKRALLAAGYGPEAWGAFVLGGAGDVTADAKHR